MASKIKIAIVGGGLAGLAAAMKIAEAGHDVDLLSVVPVKRSHSVCALPHHSTPSFLRSTS